MEAKILDRVRKLLALSKDANNPNEAALAAARASELMTEHNLSEAMLVTGEKPVERIINDFQVGAEKKGRSKRVAWKISVASAVAKTFGATLWTQGGNIKLFGRESAVQAASYTTQYLWTEVERLAKAALAEHRPVRAKAFGNSFRLGAANEISRRLREQHAAKQTERIEQAVDPHTPNKQSLYTALVRVEKAQAEVDEAYKAFSSRLSKGTPIGRISSSNAYGAGRAAGATVSLGGGARASLGAPAPRLGGR
jgi:hypothetical protein